MFSLYLVMERIIFILSYEKRWDCWMVYANRAIDAGDFFQSTGRYIGDEDLEVWPVVKKITETIRKYDTPMLFKQFGRKKYKDERMFLQKVEETYIREDIRPYIDKYVAQVLDELTEAGFPLFLKTSRLDNFYKNQRLMLKAVPLRALLKFERTGEFTRYILRLTDGEKTFYPSDYELKVLTRRPCRVVSGRQLFRFPEDFDGQRLQPFLRKREIMIPKANEGMYFRRFILKNVRHEEIEVQGFDVIIKEVEKQAFLSLERDILGMPVLVLEYKYGNQYIPGWSSRKALVELYTDGDHYAFYKVNRDPEWEQLQTRQLIALGVKNDTEGYFYLPEVTVMPLRTEKEAEDQDKVGEEVIADAWQKTVTWVQMHGDELKAIGVGFTQKALRRAYYIGAWQVDCSVSETVDWFELKAEVTLADGRRIPLLRFRDHILTGKREFLLDDGTLFLIPEEWFATYTELLLFAQGKGNSLFFRRSQYVLLKNRAETTCHFSLPENLAEEVTLPIDFQASLRPYQRFGYEWMYRLYRCGLGGCLADDMGLGKTLQAIALILKYRQEGVKKPSVNRWPENGKQLSLFDDLQEESKPEEGGRSSVYHTCLVVVPASLIHNWRNELRKFAPRLTVTIYAGTNRIDLRSYLQRSDVVLITYHTLRNDIDILSRLTFGIVIADEAQMLKNPDSQLHQAMMRIQGRCFWALSGTPIENSLTDLWSVMNWVNRGMLGSQRFFRDHFIRPILADTEGWMSEALRKLIAPYILRRTKEEVLADLPELTAKLVVCEPEEEQRKIYEEEQSRVRNYILGERENQRGLRSDFMVLKALIRLRQIANHPRLVETGYDGNSGKFNEVFRMLGEVIASGHKVLVFSSFVKYLKMVAEETVVRGWKYAMLTGLTADREQTIRHFQADPECRIFLISLKAGGVGLNLTEADYVFILDPWWNVATENQAVSRAHRIGQKRAVFVYRFITAGTLEEKILAIQERKQRLADSVITTATSIPLTDEELLEMI